jgi:hypothetical protein
MKEAGEEFRGIASTASYRVVVVPSLVEEVACRLWSVCFVYI